jgi:hypothetical protein
VELVQFEELRGPEPRVRFQAIATLHDERRSQFTETFTVERPLVAPPQADRNEATAAALSSALQAAVSNLVDRVMAALGTGAGVASVADQQPQAASGL